MWGLHNNAYGQELIDSRLVSIAWPYVGDLRKIGDDQARLRAHLASFYPHKKPLAHASWAGTLRRFAFEANVGDVVVFPNKQDRTLNFCRITGDYEYRPDRAKQPHCRSVEWLKTGAARTLFTQSALNEIGSALTMFAVKRHTSEFMRYIQATTEEDFTPNVPSPVTDDDTHLAVPSADLVDQHTRDFVADVLLTELTHEDFEHFTADLLRCMGYQAQVTQYAHDGGVDVIAHKDLLGVEPPLIKVQCKHTALTQGRPAVQQLVGTLDVNEAGLFFTLGNFSADAVNVERARHNVRLYPGTMVVDLTLRHYHDLPSTWRNKLPLRQVLAVDE